MKGFSAPVRFSGLALLACLGLSGAISQAWAEEPQEVRELIARQGEAIEALQSRYASLRAAEEEKQQKLFQESAQARRPGDTTEFRKRLSALAKSEADEREKLNAEHTAALESLRGRLAKSRPSAGASTAPLSAPLTSSPSHAPGREQPRESALDGSQVPKELDFPGPSAGAGQPRKK